MGREITVQIQSKEGETMKLSRIIALAAIALLVVGIVGVAAARSLAQPAQPPVQTEVTGATDDEQAVGPDTDNVEEQIGDQNVADTGEAVSAPDTDNVEDQAGDQNTPDSAAQVEEAGDGQDETPAGTPAITADQAQTAAEAYLSAGTASQVELDDENGQLVYSVEIGSSEVKVDAMTGAVLGVETGED
jgi:uncharacterized membrane protein YkoI